MKTETTTTTTIYKDGQQLAQFSGPDSETKAFGYLLRNQGQSVDYALKYGGYKVEVNEGGEITHWRPYSKK